MSDLDICVHYVITADDRFVLAIPAYNSRSKHDAVLSVIETVLRNYNSVEDFVLETGINYLAALRHDVHPYVVRTSSQHRDAEFLAIVHLLPHKIHFTERHSHANTWLRTKLIPALNRGMTLKYSRGPFRIGRYLNNVFPSVKSKLADFLTYDGTAALMIRHTNDDCSTNDIILLYFRIPSHGKKAVAYVKANIKRHAKNIQKSTYATFPIYPVSFSAILLPKTHKL